jgi:hypothetical protein
MSDSLIVSILSECIRAEIEVDDVQYDQMMLIYDDFNKEYLRDYISGLDVMGNLELTSSPLCVEPKLKLSVKEIDFGVVDVATEKKARVYVMTEKRAKSLEKRKYISLQWRGLSVNEKDEWKCRAREWNMLHNKKSTGYNRYLSHMYKEMSSVSTADVLLETVDVI